LADAGGGMRQADSVITLGYSTLCIDVSARTKLPRPWRWKCAAQVGPSFSGHDPFPPVIRRKMAFHDVLFGDAVVIDNVQGTLAEDA